MPKKMLLVDGFAVIHRSFHALPDFTAPDGTHVNVVYGFFSTFLKAVRDIKPNYVVIAFDLVGPTIRHKVFADYKSQRPEAPSAMAAQIPLVKELVSAMGLQILAVEGYEAEDLIATVIAKTDEEDLEYVIVTGDHDTLQLANEKVKIYFLRRGLSDVTLVDGESVRQQYGLDPKQLIDVKALRGDVSDNIPGLEGVGERTAVELVKQCGSIEQIFQGLDTIPEKYQKLLQGKQEKASLNKTLVTIHDDAPFEIKLGDFTWSDEILKRAIPMLERYEMKSLVKRIIQTPAEPPKKAKVEQESLL